MYAEARGDRVFYTDSKTDFILGVMNSVDDEGNLLTQNIYDSIAQVTSSAVRLFGSMPMWLTPGLHLPLM